MTNHPPSVLWNCWLGHQTCKNRRPYNLYCVGADVKPCSINQSLPKGWTTLWLLYAETFHVDRFNNLIKQPIFTGFEVANTSLPVSSNFCFRTRHLATMHNITDRRQMDGQTQHCSISVTVSTVG